MIRRSLQAALLALSLLAMLGVRLPAAWLAAPLEAWSAGEVRLANVNGTVWQGSGELWVRDPARQGWRPWRALRWALRGEALWRGEWRVESDLGELAFADWQWVWRGVDTPVPAALLARRLPGALGKMDWQGDVRLVAGEWRCPPTRLHACTGSAELRWDNLASPLLPLAPLGSYRLAVTADGGPARLTVATHAGPLRLSGQGEWSAGGGRFDGEVIGPPDFLVRLPNVAGDLVTATEEPGRFRLHYANP